MAKVSIESLKARIAADTAKLAEMETAEKSASAMQTLSQGVTVKFMYGRGETRAERTGIVLAVAETDKGKRIKVQYGEGFDVELAVIDPAAILEVVGAFAEVDAALEGGASADPLASLN